MQAHSLAGRFCKKYLGYEHSETGYRRIVLRHIRRILRQNANRAKKKKKNFFHHTKSSILKILSKSPRTQIRLLGTPRDFLRSHTTILGGLNFKGLASNYLLLMTLPPADDEKMKKNRTSGTPTSKKTSDSASSSKVCHTKVKLKISETNFCKSYGPASE